MSGAKLAQEEKNKSKQAVKKSVIPQQKEKRCIYIPGQPVSNIATGCDYEVVLGNMREIVFNFELKGQTITVEVEKYSSSKDLRDYGVFDVKSKKLLPGKFTLKSGEPYRIKVSRFFRGTFIVKTNGKVFGRYRPQDLDAKRYGMEAVLWVEPLYIGFSEAKKTTPLSSILNQHGQESYQWLNTLPAFNTKVLQPTFEPENIQTALRSSAANLSSPNQHAVVAVYKSQKVERVSWRDAMGEGSEMTVRQLDGRISKEDFHELVKVVAAYATPETAATLSSIDFAKDNQHWAKALNRKVQVKWVRGYIAIVFKGQNPAFGFTHAGMAHEKLKGMTGGVHIRKNERIWLSFKKAHPSLKGIAKSSVKGLAGLGLVIDLIGDYHAVMVDEKGSRSVIELFGRAGISVAAAGLGVVAASAALLAVTYGLGALAAAGVIASVPVALVLVIGAVVIAGVGFVIAKSSTKAKELVFE